MEWIILILISSVFIFVFYKQDQTIKSQIEYIDELELKILDTLEKMSKTVEVMKTIDSKGGFESDDEVGQVFKGLYDEIKKLEEEI